MGCESLCVGILEFHAKLCLRLSFLTLCNSRQIEKLTDQRIRQSINNGQKLKEMRQEGEIKLSQMKQQLNEEVAKSNQKEDEVAELRRYVLLCVTGL